MDFSEAERLGFRLAFKLFWNTRQDGRSEEELEEVVEQLLRGCEEHFRASVTRVCRLGIVANTGRADELRARALALLKAENSDNFRSQAAALIAEFPVIESWLSWWLRPSHASMLFETERKMAPDIWDSIPSTNNAQEAMHFKFYVGAGKKHDLVEGLKAIAAIVEEFEGRFNAQQGTCIPPFILNYLNTLFSC